MIRLLVVAAVVLARLPHDRGGFVHKRILGGIGGAVRGLIGGGPAGIVGGAVGGFLGGGGRGRAPANGALQAFCTSATPPLNPADAARCRAAGLPAGRPQVQFASFGGGVLSGGGGGGCPPGFVKILNRCVPTSPISAISDPTRILSPAGVDGAADPFGEAVVGRFGAGLQPAIRATETRVCPRGAVLAVDGLCYNRRDLRNSDRFWPRGRRPLLTGGEMRCISVASSAAKKLQRKQKQLQELGLLKKPSPRSRASSPVHVRTAAVAHN